MFGPKFEKKFRNKYLSWIPTASFYNSEAMITQECNNLKFQVDSYIMLVICKSSRVGLCWRSICITISARGALIQLHSLAELPTLLCTEMTPSTFASLLFTILTPGFRYLASVRYIRDLFLVVRLQSPGAEYPMFQLLSPLVLHLGRSD